MVDDIKRSLEDLHNKQNRQSEKLSDMAIIVAKQEVHLDNYTHQSDKMWMELTRMNDSLSIYNAELHTHIMGTLELKEQNRLIREEIRQREEMINDRLKIAEKPIEWIKTTADYVKWIAPIIGAVLAGIAKYKGWM